MPEIIVIGAGLSGLTAALQLRDAGVETLVLEAGSVPGGRIASIRRDGAILDTGAQFIGPRDPYTNTFALLERIGFAGDIQHSSNVAALVKRGKVVPYHYGSAKDFVTLPVVSLPSKVRLFAALAEIKRHAAILDFHHPERAAMLDDEDVAPYLMRLVGRDALEHLFEPLMGVLYYYPPSGVSRGFLLSTISGLGAVGTHCLKGGAQVLTDRLAAEVGVVTGARVRTIARKRGRWTVTWDGSKGAETADAEAVVLAVTADVAALICDTAAPSEATFLRSVKYTSFVGVAFFTNRPWGGKVYGCAIAADESSLLVGASFEQNKGADRVPADKGLSIAYLNAAASARMMAAPDDEVAVAARAEMDRFWPGFSESTEWSIVFRHQRATPLFEPGSVKRLAAFLSRPDPTPGLFFCGDYLCGPHLEGAITSGLRAADEILRARSPAG